MVLKCLKIFVPSTCSVPQSFAAPWTVACQAPLSILFSRLEYWSGYLFPSPGDLPHPGIKPKSPASPALAGRFFALCHLETPGNQVETTWATTHIQKEIFFLKQCLITEVPHKGSKRTQHLLKIIASLAIIFNIS